MTAAEAHVPTPPFTLTCNPDGIPDELKSLAQFLCWDWQFRDDRWTKPPINPFRAGYASSTDPMTHAPLDIAVKAYQRRNLAGIGFAVYEEDPFFFADLDHCRNPATGEITPWAQRILSRFCATYQEVSPSGTGMRIIGRGRMTGSQHTKQIAGAETGAKVEIFDSGKYTTLTGHRFGDAMDIADCQELLESLELELWPPKQAQQSTPHHQSHGASSDDDDRILEKARNGSKGAEFSALFDRGDISGHNNDRSSADQGLCNRLAFWFGPDRTRIDRAFRRSALMRAKWDEKHHGDGRTYGAGTIDKALDGRTEFYTPPPRVRLIAGGKSQAPPPGEDPPTDTEPERRDFNLTDTGNAERLVARHGANIRFNYSRMVWHVWTGSHWGEDTAGQMDQLAKDTTRSIPVEAIGLEGEAYVKRLGWAKSSESAGKRAAMIELARSEPGIPVLAEELDVNTWLLNVANGTLDLRTCKLGTHQRDDLITRCLRTPYKPDATCPTFLAFLERIFAGNAELITYMQRMFGYALTGSIREQAIYIAFGNGSNGKSTLLGIVSKLLGEYATEADTDSFLERQGDRIREDVAALEGARFVSASETADGKRLSEAFVKKATGGEKLRARRLFENGYTFEPKCKVWLSTNHRPQIIGTDHAIWRRIRLIPFTVTIPDSERDRDLPTKLESELPGILAWAIEGCRQWLANGEQPPPTVLQATEQYRRDMDALANWIEDRCDLRAGVNTPAKDLYADYVSYCNRSGEEPLKQRTFATRLTERGCGEKRTGSARFRTGIRIIDAETPSQAAFDE